MTMLGAGGAGSERRNLFASDDPRVSLEDGGVYRRVGGGSGSGSGEYEHEHEGVYRDHEELGEYGHGGGSVRMMRNNIAYDERGIPIHGSLTPGLTPTPSPAFARNSFGGMELEGAGGEGSRTTSIIASDDGLLPLPLPVRSPSPIR